MVVALTEREADSIADVFPAPAEEFANATWYIREPFAFGKLADATWYFQEHAAAVSLTTAFSEVSQTFAKATDVLMGMVPCVYAWDYALKTPLQESRDVYAFERGEYYRHYGAYLMNKLSSCKPLLAEQFTWGEPLWTRQQLEPVDVFQIRRRTGPPLSVVESVLGFSDLSAGWDGYSGKSVEGKTIDRALGVLNDLYERAASQGIALGSPSVGPTPEGSIQCEWDHPEAYLSLEIPRGEQPLRFYLDPRDGEETEIDAASLEEVWEGITEALSPPP